MQWKARLLLTFLTTAGAILCGILGGWFGPLLSWWWLPIISVLAFFFVVPWSPVTWSQEELKEEMDAFLHATDELQSMRAKIEEMSDSFEERGSMSLEEVQELGKQFEDQRTPSAESIRALRELLFHEHRRMIVVQLLMMFFIAVGGSLITYRFFLWFSQ